MRQTSGNQCDRPPSGGRFSFVASKNSLAIIRYRRGNSARGIARALAIRTVKMRRRNIAPEARSRRIMRVADCNFTGEYR
jgi:hypothetical protein